MKLTVLEESIRNLELERDRLQRAIDYLRAIQAELGPRVNSTRGRKSMGAEERKQVSERMRNYWQGKRTEGGAA